MPNELESGTYASSGDKVVTYWQEPDANGTEDEVWENRVDDSGREVGRFKKKDKDGNVVRKYPAPDGFENRPSFDHTDNYVRVGRNGEVYRTAKGDAISIAPGQALVEHADGTTEVLTDEYARYVFAKAHEKVSSKTDPISAEVPGTEDTQDPENDPTMTDADKAGAAKTTPAKATPATVKAGASK